MRLLHVRNSAARRMARLAPTILAAAALSVGACSTAGDQGGGAGGASTTSSGGTGSGGRSSAGGAGATDAGSGSDGSSASGGAVGSGSGGDTTAGTGGSDGTGIGGGPPAMGGSTSGGNSATGGGSVGGNAGAGGRSGPGGAANGGSRPDGAGAGGSGPGGGGNGAPPSLDLFNGKDLTGFNVYKASSTANDAPGVLVTGPAALAVFKPENGTIHVYADAAAADAASMTTSTQVHYLLETTIAYSKYVLTWEYKWGTRKFAPYQDAVKYPRDAGLLWHIHGSKMQVWPPSIEFQNKWGSTGDIYALYAQCDSLGAPGKPTQFAEASAGGTMMTVDGSNGLIQHSRSINAELPGTGPDASNGGGSDWNSCTLQVDGNGGAVYTVNGKIVNRVLAVADKSGKPVTSGYIAWQAEQAEVYYRNLRIQALP